MFIRGPYITKTVVIPPPPPVVIEVLDEDAYWHLDWQGNPDLHDGTFLYARVAYPKLSDAQRQHALEAEQGQVAKLTRQPVKRVSRVSKRVAS